MRVVCENFNFLLKTNYVSDAVFFETGAKCKQTKKMAVSLNQSRSSVESRVKRIVPFK
jgi:hypothetical protein